MDKYEYKLKLDQMKSLTAEGKYEEAAEIADTINWRKIKNINALVKVVLPQILPGVISGFALAITLSLDDYFIASYTKPATFDTISTYVVNATKGSQTEIKTALWALSTVIFVIVILIVVGMNMTSKAKARAGKAGGRYE